MSDVAVVRYLLANSAGLIAVVPATKIIAGTIPQGTALPAISVTHLSTVRRQPVGTPANVFCTSRVQVTVMAKTYPTQKSIMALVRAALPRTKGTVSGIVVDSLMPDFEGPDFKNDEIGAHVGSIDYIVTYKE